LKGWLLLLDIDRANDSGKARDAMEDALLTGEDIEVIHGWDR
jgi:hypothetical protein